MATQTTDQQNALKDAMARAKQIAAKLQQQQQASGETPALEPEETRKRVFSETAPSTAEPAAKRNAMDGAVDHKDPKVIAQQVANSLVQRLVQRGGLGSMLVEELTIPNKLVGLVIGRGGEMINKLQSESGAKIQVAPDPPPNLAGVIEDRQLTITGTTEAVSKAKELLAEIRNGGGKVPERLMGGTLPGEFSIDMIISQGKVGLVIGKGGETIKSLQERAGCKMVLFQDGEYANALEKPLRISGEQGAVMYGKQLVQDLLTMKELEAIKPDKQRQDGQNYKEIEVPREAVGFVIGSKGANINQIQMETGCRVQFKNDMVGATKTAMLTGNPQQLAAAEAKLNEILQSNWGLRGPRPWSSSSSQDVVQGVTPFGPGGQRPESGSLGVQGPVGGPRGGWAPPGSRPFSGGLGSDGNKSLQPGHKHMIINVPANKCGLVIGKGGETLKYIHSETKVNIEISRDVPDESPVRAFHVRGTDEMIENALVIIREKINDPSITAKPLDANEATPGQNQWGAPPQQNQQWAQQNHWPGQQQQSWGQQPVQPDQWTQQGVWNQQPHPHPAALGWNQPQPTNQQPNWEPQQQWQQPNAVPQGQWPNQQFGWTQPGQPYQTPNPAPPNAIQPTQPALNPVAPGDPAQSGAPQTPGQPDYSAAWALYYQQQSQYYQQYAMQQPAAVPGVTAAAPTPSTGAPVHYQSPGTPSASANNPQAQAMADYQAKLAEYYKSLGQQPPPQ